MCTKMHCGCYRRVTGNVIKLSSPAAIERVMDEAPDKAAFVSRLLASGGDRRILANSGWGTNIYGASPYPRDMLAYSATTASDISADAFGHLCRVIRNWGPGSPLSGFAYRDALISLRQRIRDAYGMDEQTDIVFAPSGTDLEYVALHLAEARSARPVENIILGLDEVGSGCGFAASGQYFATETALADNLEKGSFVAGLQRTTLTDIPVRDSAGRSRSSRAICADLAATIERATAAGRHPLAHVVHGSKSGLVLPDFAGIDALRDKYGDSLTFVVDACQARISGAFIRAYLERGAIVFVTGSKFIGGPPFSGMALIPPGFAGHAPLPTGFRTLFRRAEWPRDWPGAEHLPECANPGLLLRLEAALFELERFVALHPKLVNATIACFSKATRSLAETMGAALVTSSTYVGALESATMATLDLTPLSGSPDFSLAQRWQRILAARGVRLGQPVKCVRLPDGRWGGTLRISLSMPTIGALSALPADQRAARIDGDMQRIAHILGAACRKRVA